MSVFNQSRQNVVRIVFAAIVFVIAARLFTLQVISGKYQKLAQDNALLRKVVYPNRGIIFDRKGKAILDNTIMYDLMFTPSQIRGVDTSALCGILGIDTTEFKARIVTAIIKYGRSRPSAFEALLSPEKYARVSENLFKFQPAFFLQERPVRGYPYSAAANLLGYLAEVDSAFIKKHIEEGYQPGDYAGMSGLERAYEKQLMGQRGIQFLVKDNMNRPQGSFENGAFDTTAIAGKNLYTSLDIALQQYGEKLMKNKLGSVVAIDPRTGGVLAMISSPTYNPNSLTGPERRKNYSDLYRDPALPLYNRAIQATYPPGSTFKPLDALIALDQNIIVPAYGYPCAGVYYGCARPVKCTEHWQGHSGNLKTAITWSCNSYFSQVFRMIVDRHPGDINAGLMEWKKYLTAFGLGHRLGVDIPNENAGYIPDTTRYNKVFGANHWSSCTIVSLGIGQGEIDETPLQIANAMSMIANKGYYYTPHFADSIEGGDTSLNKYRQRHDVTHIPAEVFENVIEGMEGVVEQGTAKIAQIPGIIVCGKTGTAQSPPYKGSPQKDHALFAGFAPRDNPRIAIVAVCENSGFGASSAAPIASLMMEKYLNDTIMAARKPLEDRMLSLNLVPARIYTELRVRDSIQRSRRAQELMKKADSELEDTLELEEKPMPRADSSKQAPPAPVLPDSSKKKTRRPAVPSEVALLDDDKKFKQAAAQRSNAKR